MIREAIGIGETEELAKSDAVAQLGVQSDDGVEFEIIKKAEKKKFGLFGGSPAKVRAFINVDDDILDNTIHHDGREYITADDDLKLDMNSDNTANFTDYDHATHGVSEVVKVNGEQYVVVSWAKDSSNIDNAKLSSILKDFNKNNKVEAVAF